MSIDVKRISLWDTLRLCLFVGLFTILWGVAGPNRFFVSRLSKWNAGQWTMSFFHRLREKYGCDHLWAWFPLRRTLLVLDPKTMDAVLRSSENAADPFLKKQALSGFIPDALVVSSGSDWHDRRRFNESALDFGKPHRHCEAFKEIAFREVAELTAGRVGTLRWTDFETLAQRTSHQVLLGSGQINPDMTRQLARLVRRSNWILLPRHGRYFPAFYEQMERYLARHRDFHRRRGSRREQQANGEPVATDCLMHESARLLEEGSASAATQVPRQMGFWFFVLKDILELHVARTLVLIAAHPEVQARVREEVRSARTATVQDIDGFRYLEACIGEQLRLWTPIPVLLRRAVKRFSLRGEITIQAEQQILMHTGYYHRDPLVFGERADRFSPGAVTGAFPPVYFFSAHRQSCVGELLARFLLKATLASLLAAFRFELVAPSIRPGQIPYLCDHFKIELRPVSDAVA
jgi:cytochrome P450